MAELGSDFSCLEDLDANLTPVSGRFGLAQSIGRRYISPLGSLFYDNDYGDDLRRYVNKTGANDLKAAASAEGEAENDERIDRADVTATIAGDAMTLDITLTDSDGPFDLTLNVSSLTAELLIEPGEL